MKVLRKYAQQAADSNQVEHNDSKTSFYRVEAIACLYACGTSVDVGEATPI